jgi:hypothetical protein
LKINNFSNKRLFKQKVINLFLKQPFQFYSHYFDWLNITGFVFSTFQARGSDAPA